MAQEARTMGDRLRELRRRRVVTQAELAAGAGVSVATIRRIEAGAAVPHPRTVRKLAAALGVEPVSLVAPE
jgi:transcriptional regulator with XRE-family HTH domain